MKLIEVLESMDMAPDELIRRVPREAGECEIKWGAQATVRDNQEAIFVQDGKAVGILGPGRHILDTKNLPVVMKLMTGIVYGADSPFRAEIYYVNKAIATGLKWGTSDPIMFSDSVFNMIRLRSHGVFSLKITDPTKLYSTLLGTMKMLTTSVLRLSSWLLASLNLRIFRRMT